MVRHRAAPHRAAVPAVRRHHQSRRRVVNHPQTRHPTAAIPPLVRPHPAAAIQATVQRLHQAATAVVNQVIRRAAAIRAHRLVCRA